VKPRYQYPNLTSNLKVEVYLQFLRLGSNRKCSFCILLFEVRNVGLRPKTEYPLLLSLVTTDKNSIFPYKSGITNYLSFFSNRGGSRKAIEKKSTPIARAKIKM